ncbi:DUF6461 domain-containing protein [Gordonia sp. NPDC062954]|uniref:DUF6461 domain-containing protein n=1 Tax=Gordonia sp. NPDC062954 TaxID=3364003 RepID=UPI0037C8B84B
MEAVTTYRDYMWLDDQYAFWAANGYYATLIRDITPSDALDLLDAAQRQGAVNGLKKSGGERPYFYRQGVDFTTQEAVEVAGVGDGWTLLTSSCVGSNPDLMAPIIAGHKVISHFSDIDGQTRLTWWRDGHEQISFEPNAPWVELAEATQRYPDIHATIVQLVGIVGEFELVHDPAGSVTRSTAAES